MSGGIADLKLTKKNGEYVETKDLVDVESGKGRHIPKRWENIKQKGKKMGGTTSGTKKKLWRVWRIDKTRLLKQNRAAKGNGIGVVERRQGGPGPNGGDTGSPWGNRGGRDVGTKGLGENSRSQSKFG